MTSTANGTPHGGGRQGDLDLAVRKGGAGLVAQLLQAAAPEWDFDVVGPSDRNSSSASNRESLNMIDLEPAKRPGSNKVSFSVIRQRSVKHSASCQIPALAANTHPEGSTVIVTGSGDEYEDVEPVLDFLQRTRPRYIIHHMTKPLAKGRLWDVIRNGPLTSDGVPAPDNLVVIIDADDLRDEKISLSRALSWESTGEDFVRNLGSNGRLDTLATCPNLIVRFGSEGVIHHQGRDADNPFLFFNPRCLEDCSDTKLASHQTGLASAFTAGFALGFSGAAPRVDQGIRVAISAMQRFSANGIVINADDQKPDYPIKPSMQGLVPDKTFTAVPMPSGRISTGDKWSIFDELTGDPAEVARRVVTDGPEHALSHCSIQRFGDMQSVDRLEQESYRAILDTINEHIYSKRTSPTCIGFRGPSGSGKKYVASNLARQQSKGKHVHLLTSDTRNLRHEDLVAMCYTIRDHASRDTLSVLTFENFDHILEQRSPVLYDLQGLMRDGIFVDNGHQRSIGHAVFFFLINSEPGFFEMTPTPTRTEFREVKIVDETPVTDHLHGIVQVKGPNVMGQDDQLFPVRRAIMLRQMLERRHPHLEINNKIDVDDAVLHALLLVPAYKNGLRSMEKIIDTSRLSGKTRFDVAALPPEEQIQLHVDGRIFMSYLRAPKLPPHLREKLAHGLFEAYKSQRERMVKTDAERKALETDPVMCDWDDLSGELKESTRSQADDIPRKLRAVGCFMLNEKRGQPLIHVPQFSPDELLMLSEMEHERFNAERLQRQWRMGRRNAKQRTTPFLVPWRDLTQEWKDVDTVMVECVPGILNQYGYYIYRMKDGEK